MIYANGTIEELLNLMKLEQEGVQLQIEMPDVPVNPSPW